MIHLCYVSTATRLMTQADLLDLLATARQRNKACDVTGMLLYKDMSFVQILEGAADAVKTVYRSIQHDSRHERLKILFDDPIKTRDFSDWALGFENLDGTDLTDVPGYSSFMTDPHQARECFENATRARNVLLYFRAKS